MATLMSKLTTGVAYGASVGAAIHSFLSWLSPDEWSTVGVLASIGIAIITCVVNWYYRCKTSRATIRALKCSCKTHQTRP